MKTQIKSIILLVTIVLGFVGCAVDNPQYDKTKPISATNEPYIAGNQIAPYANTISAINSAVPSPYQAPIGLAVPAVTTLFGIVAGFIASIKNKEANNQAAAARHLASQIPDANTNQIINNAPTPQIAATVAAHLQQSA